MKKKILDLTANYEITNIESGMVRTLTGKEIIADLGGKDKAEEALNGLEPLIHIDLLKEEKAPAPKEDTPLTYEDKDQLERMTGKELLNLYNSLAEDPIVKFRDRPTAIVRIIGLLPAGKKPIGKKVKQKEKSAVTKKVVTSAAPVKITVLVEKNPKRTGSKSWDRFELYTKHPIVADFLKNGGKRADLNWDVKHGFIELND